MEERLIETILSALASTGYLPESEVYKRFGRWLEKQSHQNVFLIYLIAKG